MGAAFQICNHHRPDRCCQTRWSALQPGAAAVLAALLTTGCGGGAAVGSPEVVEPPARPLPISAVAVPGAQGPLERLNVVRRAMGVSPLAVRDALTQAATAHAAYLALNAAASVDEQPTQPGFSGRTAEQRARAAGYGGPVVLEVQADLPPSTVSDAAISPVEALLQAPLQRLRLLAPDLDEAGAAQAGGWLVATLGSSGSRRATARPAQAYPFDGQSGVSTHYSVGVEAAMFAGLPPVTGPALTLGASSFSTFRYSEVSLKAEGTGQAIPLAVPEAGTGRLASLIFFPLQPLSAGTAYVWQVTAEVDGQAGTWRARFVTAL